MKNMKNKTGCQSMLFPASSEFTGKQGGSSRLHVLHALHGEKQFLLKKR